MPLVLTLALAFGNTVEFDGERWRALLDPIEDPEEAPGPRVLFRDVRVQPRSDEVRFDAIWRIDSPKAGWFEARLTGPGVQIAEARFRGQPLAITEREDGVHVAIELEGTGDLVVRGVKEGDAARAPVSLDLMPAAVGRVRVDTDDEPVVTASGPVIPLDDGIWTSAAGLAIQVTDPTPPAPRPDLAMATSALGLTVGEGAYDGRGRLRWEVRHGELSSVAFDAVNVGSDLDVTGPAVASWDRSGDRVTVQLLQPEDRLVELELTWTGTVPSGDEANLPLPVLRPQAAFKTEASVMLARDGEIEVVPQLDGWTPTPFSALPEWGRGLTTQTATATFTAQGAQSGTVGLFRFTPVTAPPTFVDMATITAATTAEGNVLMRAHYAVRNDRSAHLRVTPPAGAQVVGARVVGETARVAIDGDTWLIPLEKSVETVEGLLSFPVEVVLLLPGSAWDRKEERALPIPTVDAPVAVTRATIHLPPGYQSLLEDGDGDVVGAWTEGEGIVYGEGTGQSAEAEALMQEAVQAWMSNSFDDADRLLRELEGLGGFDENAQRLQSNLDVISGKASGQYDVAMERRVKEQAKARSEEDKAKQEEALKEAESSYLSGDYGRAEEQYRQALELGQKLDLLEQEESIELEVANEALQTRLAEAEKKKADKQKNAPAKPVLKPPAAASPGPQRVEVKEQRIEIADGKEGDVLTKDFLDRVPAGRSFQSATGVAEGQPQTTSDSTTIDFENIEIDGELVKPQGQLILDGRRDIDERTSAGVAAGGGGTGGDFDFKPQSGEEIALEELGYVEYGETIDVGEAGGELISVPPVHRVARGELSDPEPMPEPEVQLDSDGDMHEFSEEYWVDEPVDAGSAEELLVVERRKAGIRLPDIPNIRIGKGKKADELRGVPGGVEGGVVGGVVGGAYGASVGTEATGSDDGVEISLDQTSEDLDDILAPRERERFEDEEEPPVRAVQLTAIIPSQGQAVRYEHLLLEAGATYALPIEAKSRRRDR